MRRAAVRFELHDQDCSTGRLVGSLGPGWQSCCCRVLLRFHGEATRRDHGVSQTADCVPCHRAAAGSFPMLARPVDLASSRLCGRQLACPTPRAGERAPRDTAPIAQGTRAMRPTDSRLAPLRPALQKTVVESALCPRAGRCHPRQLSALSSSRLSKQANERLERSSDRSTHAIVHGPLERVPVQPSEESFGRNHLDTRSHKLGRERERGTERDHTIDS